MAPKRCGDDGRVGDPCTTADTVTVTVDFNRKADAELFALVTAVPPGKQRARRVRSLMLIGHAVELVRGGSMAPASEQQVPKASRSGAEDVFEAPVER